MAGLKCYQLAVLLLLSCNALAATHDAAASETGVAAHTSTLGTVESTVESGAVESTAERSLQTKPLKKPKCPGNLTLFQQTKTVIEKVKKGKKITTIKKTIIIGYYCACKPGFKPSGPGGKFCVKNPPHPKPSPKFG